jgi:kumamolisin
MSTHVTLEGSRRFHQADARILGRADAHALCEVTVRLRRARPLPDPSTLGGATLSHADLATTYAAGEADMALTGEVLENAGLRLLRADASACLMRFRGPAAAMEAVFGVHLLRARRGDEIYRARVGVIHIPKELDGIVIGVFGLDTRPMGRRSRSPTFHDVPQATAGASDWFFPADLARIYNFPPGDGTGQTIGLIEFGGAYHAPDLTQFLALANIATEPRIETVQVESPTPDDPDAATGELMLDIEVIAGLCPAATIRIYFTNFTEQGWVEAMAAVVNDADQQFAAIAVCTGTTEGQLSWTSQAMCAVDDSLKAAANLGITICVASGDSGSSDGLLDGQAHVDFPASSPNVLAVGGTTLTLVGGARQEVAWMQGSGIENDGANGGSSGGGVSMTFPRPNWQSVLVASVNPQAFDGRCVPDVAANAATSPGYAWVNAGVAKANGGTSAAAPLWAAFIARLSAARGPGRRVGFLTPLLYQATANTGGAPLGQVACNDVVSGNNNTAAAGGYAAGVGYDAVTGWGSPDGARFLQSLP